MTDNEIIKALECCTKGIGECKNCPYFKMIDCATQNVKDVINLINRQKEETDKLEKVNASLTDSFEGYVKAVNRYREAIERHKGIIKILENDVKSAKAEAIKEFAERLKDEIINDTAYACDSTQHNGYYDYKIKIGDIPEYIDSLVKEMTEHSEVIE